MVTNNIEVLPLFLKLQTWRLSKQMKERFLEADYVRASSFCGESQIFSLLGFYDFSRLWFNSKRLSNFLGMEWGKVFILFCLLLIIKNKILLGLVCGLLDF